MGNDETVAGSPPTETRYALLEAEPIAGRYRVVRWIGGGGMGNVYEAIDSELGELVALKVLGGGLSEDAIERFRREVRLTRRIRHANVARMFDIGEHAGSRFLTMELVQGAALSRSLGTPMPWARLQPIARQICAGLAAAHAEGVIHRDLKPDNVLVERETERVVVTDFGIARSSEDVAVTLVGEVIGTPRYMAPEQLVGDPATARSDLFALGVMLFELATATKPWTGKSAADIARSYATQPRRPFAGADCPPAFATIVERCIALQPSDRPASANEVERAIAACEASPAAHPPADHRPATAIEEPTRRELPVARARPSGAPATRPSTPEVPTGPGRSLVTVAVMPFTAAPEDAYLADGMIEDMIDTLSSTPVLRVRPVGPGGRGEPDPRELGARLGVDHVVSGSVRRIPSGLRVAARMTSVADGFQIWARRSDATEAEVLALADSLALEIAATMSTRATTGDKPTDPRAVDLYLRARAELRQYWGSYVVEGAKLLEQALVFAPSSPPILAAFAFSSAQAWALGAGTAERVRDATDRALVYGHGDAYLAASIYKINRGDNEGAIAELAVALARAPMSSHAHEFAGRLLSELGVIAEARFHYDSAAQLDPGRSAVVVCEKARLDALEGNWPAAFGQIIPLTRSPDLAIAQFASMYDARLHGWHRDRVAMVEAASRNDLRSNEHATAILMFVTDSVSNERIDDVAWSRLVTQSRDVMRPRRAAILHLQLLAELAALFGEQDRTIEALRGADAMGLMDIVWLDRCPLFDAMDPIRFKPIRDLVAARAARVLAAFRTASSA